MSRTLTEWQAETLTNSRRWFPFPGSTRDQIIHQALGIAGEGGEVIEHVKKYHRGDFDIYELRDRLADELPDALTYVLNLAELLSVDLDEALTRKQAISEERWG